MVMPESLPETPSGKQTWLLIKIVSARTELANLTALLARFQGMQIKGMPEYSQGQGHLIDLIQHLQDAQEKLQKYINALELEMPFND